MLDKVSKQNVNLVQQTLGYMTLEKDLSRDVLISIYRIQKILLPGYLASLVTSNHDYNDYGTRCGDAFT